MTLIFKVRWLSECQFGRFSACTAKTHHYVIRCCRWFFFDSSHCSLNNELLQGPIVLMPIYGLGVVNFDEDDNDNDNDSNNDDDDNNKNNDI